ncbi:hypothetical protein PENSPDRAFT_733367 [Peniophora sp. CONT]|nr:hypothetical protein PENSPDRAFT_733367 [Peniophora sp. CONT]
MDVFGLSAIALEPPKVRPRKEKNSKRNPTPHTEAGLLSPATSQPGAHSMHIRPQPYAVELGSSSKRSDETELRHERLRVLAGAGVPDRTRVTSSMPFTPPHGSSSETTSTNPSNDASDTTQLQHQPPSEDRTQTRAQALFQRLGFSRSRYREPKWDIATEPAARTKALSAIPREEAELQDAATVSEGSGLAEGEAADRDTESTVSMRVGYAY